jgi:hypothetical protein
MITTPNRNRFLELLRADEERYYEWLRTVALTAGIPLF